MLVHVAALLYVIGFSIRDQLKLRLLVLVATALYIGYYYLAADTPLWEAIIWSVILGAANLWVIAQILRDRTTLAMGDDETRLFEALGTMQPGEFRRLAKLARFNDVDDPLPLTRQGEPVRELAYLLTGAATVNKNGAERTLPAGHFLGEIGFQSEGAASADVRIEQGSRVVLWRADELRELCRRDPALRLALDQAISRDLARKVALS